MLTDTFQSITSAARRVLGNWRAILLPAVVYALLLAALYFFVVVREASLVQVILTLLLAIASPVLFFLLQALIVGGMDTERVALGPQIKNALHNFWKLVLVTLPLIALAVLIAFLLSKAQTRLGSNLSDEAFELSRRAASARDTARPIDWKTALLSTVRYLTLGLILPLTAIHLWLVTAQEGLRPALGKFRTLVARVFSPQSVLVYVAGFVVFAVVPYFILFRTTPAKQAWLEISLLVLRLAAVFALTLIGWVITVKALADLTASQADSDPAGETV